MSVPVWKVTVAEKGSLAKDYWYVPATNIEGAIRKAKKNTAKGWLVEKAELMDGDWIA